VTRVPVPACSLCRGNPLVHARVSAHAAMVYNSRKPAHFPAIAVVPAAAVGIADEINAIVMGPEAPPQPLGPGSVRPWYLAGQSPPLLGGFQAHGGVPPVSLAPGGRGHQPAPRMAAWRAGLEGCSHPLAAGALPFQSLAGARGLGASPHQIVAAARGTSPKAAASAGG
jgi:hypothetical protein